MKILILLSLVFVLGDSQMSTLDYPENYKEAIDYITKGSKSRSGSFSSCSADVYVENTHREKNIEIKYRICSDRYKDGCSSISTEVIRPEGTMMYGSTGCFGSSGTTIKIIDARFSGW